MGAVVNGHPRDFTRIRENPGFRSLLRSNERKAGWCVTLCAHRGGPSLKLFKCQHCGQILYFENSVCQKCSHQLGYDPMSGTLLALEPMANPQPDQQNLWRAVGAAGRSYRFCSNASFGVCNWLIDAGTPEAFCL